jgi:SAM-dependent methyltransferase
MDFHQFDVEAERFPYGDASFDALLFCEIIEHLHTDPMKVMKEIKRVLKPGGVLVLTTPNVAKLQNRLRLLAGKNINDRYSGYGPYGRHNREYTRNEVSRLLHYCGFDQEEAFTADVHFSNSLMGRWIALQRYLSALTRWSRYDDLGQYIFIRARSVRPIEGSRPDWLFRSFAD